MSVLLPPDLIELVAQRAAEVIAERLAEGAEEWIGVQEAAAHLCCSAHRVYRLVAQAKGRHETNPIPFETEGQRLLFRRSSLDAWVARGRDAAR